MKRMFKGVIIGFILIFELLCFGLYNPWPHGDILDVRYRRKERMAAFWESREHPSPTAKAAFDAEFKRLRCYELVWTIVILSLVVTAVGVGIYYYGKWENGDLRLTSQSLFPP